MLVGVHPCVVQAQVESWRVMLQVLEPPLDGGQVIRWVTHQAGPSPFSWRILVEVAGRHIDLPNAWVISDQRLRAAAEMGVKVENEDRARAGRQGKAGGYRQTVECAESFPGISPRMMQTAGKRSG